jgi:sodium-dependent dicarboxylate transporter 2/3/5
MYAYRYFLLGPFGFIGLSLVGAGMGNFPLFLVLGLAVWMIVWWVTDVVPMAVTALLPMIVFPAAGILSIKEAATNYANPTIYLFLGGFLIAIGMEKSGLHLRFALQLIRYFGQTANGIIWGFLLATALISMWVSNTATALMMLPIGTSVIDLMKERDSHEEDSPGFRNFSLCLMLSIAYAANIGGAATLIGTPPNVVLAAIVKSQLGITLSFATYLLVGLPIMMLTLGAAYWLLVKWFYPNHIGAVADLDSLIKKKLTALGAWNRREKAVAGIFGLTAFLWVFGGVLNSWMGRDLLDDTIVALTGAALMFLLPISASKRKFVLTWEDTKGLPWNILLLFGGGLCLAAGMNEVGLMKVIGTYVTEHLHVSPFVLMVVLTGIMLLMTELMSNVALATIFIPVVIVIAQGVGENPVLFAVSVAIASSYAFMLPIGTPPNAIVYGTGHIKMAQMIKAGLWLNIVGIVVISAVVWMVGQWVF